MLNNSCGLKIYLINVTKIRKVIFHMVNKNVDPDSLWKKYAKLSTVKCRKPGYQ